MLWGCKKEEPINYVILSGTITNKTEDFTIMSRDRSFKHALTMGEDGSFLDTLRVNAGTYMLYGGKNVAAVYLEKGNNIIINADANNFDETLSFSGKGSEVSKYLVAKSAKEKELKGEGRTFYTLEEADFKAKAKEIETTLKKMVDTQEGVSEEFKAKEKKDLHYAYLMNLNSYGQYHSYYAKKPDFKPSDSFLTEFKDFDFNNEEDYIASANYRQLVSGNVMDEAQKMIKDESLSYNMASLKSATNIKNEYIKNDILYSTAKMGMTFTNDVQGYYKIFMDASTDDKNNKEISETYNKLKTVAPGQPSPKFVDYENYAGGSTSLDDLKGKYVYIDIWATWCGPCKAEIPFLQKVEKQYHGKNIEFVSISVDRKADHDKWKAMVKEKELGGIQLFTGNDFKTKFIEDYFVMGIPKFILLDPNGDIVQSSAPRPSDEKLIELFDELGV
ncbi:TlpA family protein disulfide reductase [Algibacter sp. Ld11]|uniref:TlpA family protein disulfide reductase n=1 Tax=Algibacter sp. Ld11 TaxID=649150 RepID=UPI003864157F